MSTLTFRALFPFCGVGGGALGFRDAEADFRALGFRARFEIAGGIEWDASTARDFERLTGAPCMVADVAAIAPEQLRAALEADGMTGAALEAAMRDADAVLAFALKLRTRKGGTR